MRRTRETVEPAETLIHKRARVPEEQIIVSDERADRRGEAVLGRYRPIERLGAGGFGVVWRAHDELLDREVALKRIPLPSEEDRERALREAHATARLAHPAIVALYEACADGDAFYLISELVEGDTLDELIAQDALSDEEILEIGAALADALRHAHGRGVIHRDVKPSNVLVPCERGQGSPSTRGLPGAAAKLADFGGARIAEEDALTRAGDVLGTLAYMAPEQSEGLEVGAQADLYSLALVVYEALSGVNPVRGRTPAETARRIGTPIERLQRRRRDLPRELTRTIDAALHPDPARRGTLDELQESFESALERSSMEGVPVELGSVGRGLTRKAHARTHDVPPPVYRDPVAPAGPAPAIEEPLPPARSRRLALPRLVWIGCVLAVAIWQAAAGRAGVSLLALAAGAPLALLPRRAGPDWLTAALAPVLGMAGLSGAFPAVAGQWKRPWARAGLGALGFWWLALAEPLLGRRLWEGPPKGVPARAVWEGSPASAATHVIGALLTPQLAIGLAVWAAGSLILPWLVRGRSAALDVIAVVAWMVALLAAPSLLASALAVNGSVASPHGALLGAAFGCALAVCARALRGP